MKRAVQHVPHWTGGDKVCPYAHASACVLQHALNQFESHAYTTMDPVTLLAVACDAHRRAVLCSAQLYRRIRETAKRDGAPIEIG